MKSPFVCPYCGSTGLVDLSGASGAHCLVVCEGCAGYVVRHADEWQSLDTNDQRALIEYHPDVMRELDRLRVAMVEAWIASDRPAPTIFAAVMIGMYQRHGPQSICFMKATDDARN